jgi:hypothetical protein
MRNPLEDSVENYLVKKVKELGGIALKGDVKGQRFLDRIIILPEGRTIWCEVKRPEGGRYSKHQDETLKRLTEMGHACARVKTKDEVDLLLREISSWSQRHSSSSSPSSSDSSTTDVTNAAKDYADGFVKGAEFSRYDIEWAFRKGVAWQRETSVTYSGEATIITAETWAYAMGRIDRAVEAEGSADEK